MKYTEKQTLAEKTAQNLLEMIQEKGYGAGDKLPTEAELVETLGVGRNTVREPCVSLCPGISLPSVRAQEPLFPTKTGWQMIR